MTLPAPGYISDPSRTQGEVKLSLEDTVAAVAALEARPYREVLAAPRTYYVRTDGNDAHTGLANTAGGAFATIQQAINVISGTLDLGGQTVTIQVADGTYTTPCTLKACVGIAGAGGLVIQGNNASPGNVVISTTGASCFTMIGPTIQATIKDLKVQTTTAGYGFVLSSGCFLLWSNLIFGAVAYHHWLLQGGAVAQSQTGGYAIEGNATFHVFVTGNSVFLCESVGAVTLSGTPVFSTFVYAEQGAMVRINGNTYSGPATGSRYGANSNAVIFTNGAGGSYLPGSTAGTTATGGQYV